MRWAIFYFTISIINIANAASRRTSFHPNHQGRSYQIYGLYDVSPIIPSWNFPESDLANNKACTKNDVIAKGTRAAVESALSGTLADMSDLKMSFRQTFYFSTPPLTLYRNCRPGGYSNLIFGVPLVDLGMNEENVPKVMRMCIEEVEKRGLNVGRVYSVRLLSRHVPRYAKWPDYRLPYVPTNYGRPV